jgi:hypothetical protein
VTSREFAGYQFMIIRPHGDSLLFITQPDHARLAADLLAHWTADDFATHPRREALLLAAREHDNGWREVDDAPVFSSSTGMALDFIGVADEIKQSVWPRAIERVGQTSAYAAALVAQHAISVYDSNRPKPSWTAFFTDMESRRDQQLDGTIHSAQELADDYRFLNVVDLLSLAFCNAWTDERERYGCRVRYADESIDVSPGLFDNPVAVRIRARRMPARRFASSADLRAAFDDTPPELVEGYARGARHS